MSPPTEQDLPTRWPWLALSAVLLAAAAVKPVPDTISLGAYVIAAGLWLAGRLNGVPALRVHVDVIRVRLGTLLFGWGAAAAAAVALMRAREPIDALGDSGATSLAPTILGIISVSLLALSIALMVVAALTVVLTPLMRAGRHPRPQPR